MGTSCELACGAGYTGKSITRVCEADATWHTKGVGAKGGSGAGSGEVGAEAGAEAGAGADAGAGAGLPQCAPANCDGMPDLGAGYKVLGSDPKHDAVASLSCSPDYVRTDGPNNDVVKCQFGPSSPGPFRAPLCDGFHS